MDRVDPVSNFTQDKVLCFLNAAGTLVTFPLDPAVLSALAPLASPALTGQPVAPSPASTDNSQQIANTSWVRAFISSLSSTVTPLVDGAAAMGTSTLFARADHVHPTDTTRAKSGANSDITSLAGLTNPTLIDNCGRLVVANSTTLAYQPYNGNQLVINGTAYTIPVGGWTYTATGLATATTYYVYAYVNNGTPTLYLVNYGWLLDPTGRAVANNNGSPNSSYRLLGMVRTVGTNTFSGNSGYCLSYSNRKSVCASFIGSYGCSSTSVTQMSSIYGFLCWSDELTWFNTGGEMVNTVGSDSVAIYLVLDGSQAVCCIANQANNGYYYSSISLPYAGLLTEGWHTLYLGGAVSNSNPNPNGVYSNVFSYVATRG